MQLLLAAGKITLHNYRKRMLERINPVICHPRPGKIFMNGTAKMLILSRVGMTIRRGLDRVIGFIALICSTHNYKQLQLYRKSTHFTVHCCKH
jgi:hypothetical protein